jgi:hypothetical protein
MPLQTHSLTVAALGVAQDAPPDALQPPLADGVHLRWTFARALGFPRYGYHLFRREHRAGTPRRLSEQMGALTPGPWSGSSLETPLGSVTSDRPLQLTDDFSAPGVVEFDLRHHGWLRFVLPSGVSARKLECRLGFRDRADLPPKTCVDFTGQAPGSGANPRREEDSTTREVMTFHARHQTGTPRPNTHIEAMQLGGTSHTGLSCEGSLEITLPAASSYVEATVSGSVSPVTVEAYNEDGTLAGRKTSTDPKGKAGRGPELLRIDGGAVTRVVVRGDNGKNLLHRLCCQPIPVATIRVTGFLGRTPVAHTVARGRPGQIVAVAVEFDGMDAVELGPGPAGLIDVGVVALADDATIGWAPAPGFPAPMRLPLTHPDYPCTTGEPENLEQARALARQRVSYGDPAAYTTVTPRTTNGTVSVVHGSPIVVGLGTSWTADLAGVALRVSDEPAAHIVLAVLAPDRLILSRPYAGPTGEGKAYAIADDRFAQFHDQLVHLVAGSGSPPMAERAIPTPVTTQGTISLTRGSTIVSGTDTAWGPELAGLALTAAGDATSYIVAEVQSGTRLVIARPYVGASASATAYSLTARLHGAGAGQVPSMPRQRPLDLVLLAALNPAFAQMLGIYWVDRAAQPGVAYDYLLVADHDGRGQREPATVLSRIAQSGFEGLDAFVVHNRSAASSPALAAPTDVQAYALPGTSGGATAIGLRWNLSRTEEGVLVPSAAIMYHLWRADLGASTPAAPPVGAQYKLRSSKAPVFVTASSHHAATARRAPDWPPFPLHTTDSGMTDGWYSYRVSGIDIFGRHSAVSAPAAWHQWSPAPEPRPWYYKDPPSAATVHPFAVQVPDFVPPPHPGGVEAYALDPADPAVLRDAAYVAWWTALQAAPWYQALSAQQKRDLIGLRVRWRWTQAQMRQAPDVKEFRIYYQTGRLNALLGHTTAVLPAGDAETTVKTSIENDRAAGAYAGAWLRVGTDSFTIVASEGGTPLRLRVRNLGAASNVRPRVNTPCTVALPPFYAEGRVTVSNGSPVVTGDRTAWTSALAGQTFQVVGDAASYVVASVDSPVRLTLSAPYAGESAPAKGYGVRHPLFVDYGTASSWERRFYVVDFAAPQHVQSMTDAADDPQWHYDVFLPRPDGSFRAGVPLAPSRGEPVAYAHVGVSAADDKAYAPDARKTGALSGRPGNEGRLAPPSTVFRVLRERPPAPLTPPFPEVLQATRADANGRSFFTFRWVPIEALQTHIFRAMDESVLAADWRQRPRPVIDPVGSTKDQGLFPTDARWTDAKRLSVAAELNALNALKSSGVNLAEAREQYRALSNDAWRVLAGLPGNDAAFTQLTAEPLDPDDPATADRRGPDDADSYMPDTGLRAFSDVLEGRTVNRYFYQAAYVDGAGNRGPMGLASPAVRLPKVGLTAAPVWNAVALGDGSATLRWASSREADVAEYRLFRTDSELEARDIRRMQQVHAVSLSAVPADRPPALQWTDTGLQGGKRYHYRLVAVDASGNVSVPSETLTVRAVDTRIPAPPVWLEGRWILLSEADGSEHPWPADGAVPTGHRPAMRLVWKSGVPGATFRVSRQARGDLGWRPLAVTPVVLEPGRYHTYDTSADSRALQRYRITATSATGVTSLDFSVLDVPKPLEARP